MEDLVWTKCSWKLIFSSMFAAILMVANPSLVSAHSNHVLRYANSKIGVDQGDCSNPENPCLTFDYTRSQAGKGDQVCLAFGRYRVDYKNAAVLNLKLFNSLIPVKGNCLSHGNLDKSNSSTGLPVITGLPEIFAARLEKMDLEWGPRPGIGPDLKAQDSANQAIRIAQAGGRRYVDGKSGADVGDCANANAPCRTFSYTRGQANPGDTVNVASGSYTVLPDEVRLLLADDIRFQGGFSTASGFTDRGLLANPTYIVGLSHRNRAALKQRGFILLQDRKALKVEAAIASATPAGAQQDPIGGPVLCVDGKSGEFPCNGVDYLARIALHQFSSNPGAANDIWGFVDLNDEKEYAIIGLENGSAVVEVTNSSSPRLVPAIDRSDPVNPISTGNVIAGATAIWRDIKVYQFYNEQKGRYDAYAYVTTDGPQDGSGELQVIDLTGLPAHADLVTHKSNYKSAHNVYISNVDYATGVAVSKQLEPSLYILGSNLVPAGATLADVDKEFGAFRVYSLNPNPVLPSEIMVPPSGTLYVHDATTLIVEGEQATQCGKPAEGIVHNPCEVLIDFNEDSVDLWDVTDKTIPPIMLSTREYENSSYTHSGWWSADKKHIFIHDELDEYKNEQGGPKLNTTVRIMSIENLRNPGPIKVAWTGPTKDIDHNGFAKGNTYYMSNYLRGLTVLDITHPQNSKAIAGFDTAPEIDDNDFGGAWGVYPYLRSGSILVSDIQRGLFVLRLQQSPE